MSTVKKITLWTITEIPTLLQRFKGMCEYYFKVSGVSVFQFFNYMSVRCVHILLEENAVSISE